MPLPISPASLAEWFIWAVVVSVAWHVGRWIIARTLDKIP